MFAQINLAFLGLSMRKEDGLLCGKSVVAKIDKRKVYVCRRGLLLSTQSVIFLSLKTLLCGSVMGCEGCVWFRVCW
jgi:hypothetical protein